MQFSAKARYIRISPFKLRPIIDVVRGKKVDQALRWLATMAVQRSVPIKKMIESAAANAKNLQNISESDLKIKDIRVDHGPMFRYFKPGAMGRSNVYRKRLSHASIVLESIVKKEE